ncbi:unnamed protein product [Microthlaspi erraticum]|uniref:F-box associated beta-propeller type 1 domain-containing protein n=1 Tax=Microthlaspi erraticum TaxID=1685480 RepID=A0A6D2I690_9BRAS|nr:unnamed protein product [Microthlaspi erraticum]
MVTMIKRKLLKSTTLALTHGGFLISAPSAPSSLRNCMVMRLTNGLPDGFPNQRGPMSFFIDEEKKVALLFYLETHTTQTKSYNDQMVYIFGEDGYLRSVNMGPVPVPRWDLHQLVGSSYVPSLVQLQV